MSLNLKDDVLRAIRDTNPGYIPPASVKFNPPNIGSSVQKPCKYKTPCGWCDKWDKKCDMKTPETPIINQCDYPTNKICQSEEDHEWECCTISTAGSTFVCKKCGAYKSYPTEYRDYVSTTISNNKDLNNITNGNGLELSDLYTVKIAGIRKEN